MMVLIYGFSLMYLLSGIMAYEVGVIEVFGIALMCYVFDKVIFKNLRRLLTVSISVMLTLGVVTYILYRLNDLETVLAQLYDFAKVYYLSMTVETVSIAVPHQLLLVTFMGVVLMRLLEKYIHIWKWNYLYLQGISVLLVVGGFLTDSLGSLRDQQAFMMICGTMILYYFYNYFTWLEEVDKKFYPIIANVAAFVVIVVLGAKMLYSMEPRPLIRPVSSPSFQVSSDIESQTYDYEKLSYYRQESFEIQDSFDYENIQVLRVQTDNMRYLKAETYEIYEDGQWSKADELDYLEDDGNGIHKSELVDAVNYARFYAIEPIEVEIVNINTNVLFVNNYAAIDTRFSDGIRVMFDPRRGIYYAQDLLKESYTYGFDAIIPKYGDPNFEGIVRENSNKAVPSQLSIYEVIPEDGYEDLKDLALEITQGIDNPYDKVLAIESYLKSNYIYNLEPGETPEGVDPINHFLFERKEGFCQQFSSAFILMARSVGVPTRYATGFYVNIFEPEDLGDALMMEEYELMEGGMTSVYDSDAHTWAEAYFPEVGWIMFEATPGRYYRDDVLQSSQLDALKLQEKEENVGGGIALNYNIIMAFFAVLLLGIIIYGVYVYKRYRQNLMKMSGPEKLRVIHDIVRYYYSSGTLKKQTFETPREYAKRVDDYLMDWEGETFIALMSDYEDVVYGGKIFGDTDLTPHINYREKARKLTKKRVNIFIYYKMRLYDYFNFDPGIKVVRKA